jgi:hypothetical protein
MKLAAGIIFFNDRFSLQRCLYTLINDIDIIFAVDGKFPNFPGSYDLSTDGSREVLKSFSKCHLIDFPKSEFEKRSKYLQLCKVNNVDVLLIIDSDEFVLENAEWSTFKENLKTMIVDRDKCTRNVYAVDLQINHSKDEFLAFPRIWYKPDEMEYYGEKHYYFRNKNGLKNNLSHQADHSVNVIKGIRLGHDHTLRTKKHMDSRFIYQTWLQNYEKSLPH